MHEITYSVIFSGEIISGQQLDDVRNRVEKSLKVSGEKLNLLFSGKPFTLKKQLTLPQAEKFQSQLCSLGIVTQVQAESIAASASSPASPSTLTSAATVSAQQPQQSAPVIELQQPVLVLEPIKAASPALTLENIDRNESRVKFDTVDEPQTKQSVRHINIQLNPWAIIHGLFWMVAGAAAMVVFSPLEDEIIRKGFAMGLIFTVVGMGRLRRGIAS